MLIINNIKKTACAATHSAILEQQRINHADYRSLDE